MSEVTTSSLIQTQSLAGVTTTPLTLTLPSFLVGNGVNSLIILTTPRDIDRVFSHISRSTKEENIISEYSRDPMAIIK